MSIHSLGELLDSIELNHGKDFRDAVLHRVLVKQGIPHLPHRGTPSKIPHCGKLGCDGSCLDVECDGSTPHSRQQAAVADALRVLERTKRRMNIAFVGVAVAWIAAVLFGSSFMQKQSSKQAAAQLEDEWRAGKLQADPCACPTVTR